MSEEPLKRDEAKLASTLGYGLLGGFAGAGSCCCWPVSVGIAWWATRRAVDRGTIAPGEGIGYGVGLGVVMGLVMSTLGTALALKNLEEPQGEMITAMLADTPLGLLAAVLIVLLGGIGFVSGALGGLLGGGGRPPAQDGISSSVVVRPEVPVPGSVGGDEFSEDGEDGEDGEDVEDGEDAEDGAVSPDAVTEQRVNPEDFVTAVSDSGASWPTIDLRPVSDVERTVTIDQEPTEGFEGTEDEEEPVED